MLNIFLSVILLNITVLTFFFAFKLNRVEQIFSNLDVPIVESCTSINIENEKYFFVKDKLIENVLYYFSSNLENYEYKLKFSFREDDLNTVISDYPNIVQIDINARILFEGIYQKNVRFTLNGREVSKDWWSTF